MRGYNIYYKNMKINSKVLTKEEVDNTLNKTYILKQSGNDTTKISTSKIRVVPCIIVWNFMYNRVNVSIKQ